MEENKELLKSENSLLIGKDTGFNSKPGLNINSNNIIIQGDKGDRMNERKTFMILFIVMLATFIFVIALFLFAFIKGSAILSR